MGARVPRGGAVDGAAYAHCYMCAVYMFMRAHARMYAACNAQRCALDSVALLNAIISRNLSFLVLIHFGEGEATFKLQNRAMLCDA